MKKLLAVLIIAFSTAGCTDAELASSNLSKASEMFEVTRRVVFYDAIQGEYLLSIEGKCSFKATKKKLEVTCKNAHDKYVKHVLGISDNVTYFVEQLEHAFVDTYHYRVVFKPQTFLPNIDVRVQ